jgi:hypothetical protein
VPEEAGWFVEDEDWLALWLVESDVDAWLVAPEVDGWLAEADADGWFVEAEDENGVEADAWPEPLPAVSRPAMFAPAALARSIAAWVRGPMTPSTGPGSKPLSFSACWSCRTDSSPPAWLAPNDAPCDEAMLPEADWSLEVLLEGWFADDEAVLDGWLAEAELEVSALCDCEALEPLSDEADEDGWLLAARAVPAAINAATRASFLNSMSVFLSSMKVLPATDLQATCLGRAAVPRLDSPSRRNIRRRSGWITRMAARRARRRKG